MLRLAIDDLELLLAPECGGGIAAFRWRGIDVMRAGVGASSVLGLASFPLLPFSNRIAGASFAAHGRTVALPPNFATDGRAELIHGFGWQAAWQVAEHGAAEARITHSHRGGDWPWPYFAEQHFALTGDGLVHQLRIRNDGNSAMPAGLGIHPYFPRAGARLDLPLSGRWESDGHCLPTGWTPLAAQPEWFGGDAIDHVFTGRRGPIGISWPSHRLTIAPTGDLGFTVVYVPQGADYFCVEPVSHMTNAVNRDEGPDITGLRWLAPGESWDVSIVFAVA